MSKRVNVRACMPHGVMSDAGRGVPRERSERARARTRPTEPAPSVDGTPGQWHIQGSIARPLAHLSRRPAETEVAPLLIGPRGCKTTQAGCRGFTGPYPSAPLDEVFSCGQQVTRSSADGWLGGCLSGPQYSANLALTLRQSPPDPRGASRHRHCSSPDGPDGRAPSPRS